MTDERRQLAKDLKLYGLIAHWDEVVDTPWVTQLLDWEANERHQRTLERRLKSARIGRFKSLDEFDWG